MEWVSPRLAVPTIAVATVCLGGSEARWANPAEPRTVSLLVVDEAAVPPDAMSRAKAEAARIFDKLHVKLIWTDGSNYRFGVKIVAAPLPAKEADLRALGVAPGTTTARGTLAYAFYDRISDFAAIHRMDLGVILGHVIAHELGHLLLPYNSHSRAGIMSETWDQQQALRASKGALAFDPNEAKLIRMGLCSPR